MGEKRQDLNCDAILALNEFRGFLSIPNITAVRYLYRYDVSGISREMLMAYIPAVLFDCPSDTYYLDDLPKNKDDFMFAVKFLPGVFDQRADSAAVCFGAECEIARVYIISGDISDEEKSRIKQYVINHVDEREVDV